MSMYKHVFSSIFAQGLSRSFLVCSLSSFSASAMSFAQVSVEELFGSQVEPEDMIQYERLRHEPKVFCAEGHEVILSRIPWQSGCNKCKAWNGWRAQAVLISLAVAGLSQRISLRVHCCSV